MNDKCPLLAVWPITGIIFILCDSSDVGTTKHTINAHIRKYCFCLCIRALACVQPVNRNLNRNFSSSIVILFLSAGYKSVKIALILPILNGTVFLKFTLGKGFCDGRCYFPLMMQHFFLVKLQKRIQPCDPIPHIHDVSTARLPLA